ncbi:MAG: NigD-like protein [Paenibacillus sp.]|nr:NigD-like protein [Paenibacillus sp.]
MRKAKLLIMAGLMLASAMVFQSCDDDNNDVSYMWQPTALVTVCPQEDESVMFQLDNETRLRPVNMKKSPYGKKEVRALVNYNLEPESASSAIQDVRVNWIDSIRTKLPVPSAGVADAEKYGDDPIDIVKDWVTIAEDGYLTLRVRTVWGPGKKRHDLNMLTGVNPDDPMEFELRHNANGDVAGTVGDALIAFNLNEVIGDAETPVKITLKWKSPAGDKSVEFDMSRRKVTVDSEDVSAISSHVFM